MRILSYIVTENDAGRAVRSTSESALLALKMAVMQAGFIGADLKLIILTQ